MNVFDIMGPVMIGPSSSHTAGAARIGYVAQALLADKPIEVKIGLHGSFAKTYKGHGTDKALVAGILGMQPDDIRLRDSLLLAKEAGLCVAIRIIQIDGAHPNTAAIALKGENGREITLQGSSVGGGNILITAVNSMPVEISAQSDTVLVLHRDTPGMVAAVSEYLGEQGVNISAFRLTRSEKGGLAIMTIEADEAISEEMNAHIGKMPNIVQSSLLHRC